VITLVPTPAGTTTGQLPPVGKARFFAVCFVLEAMVFAILPLSSRLPLRPLLYLHACVTAIFLAAALLARKSDAAERYWQVLYALFVAATAVLLSTLFSERLLEAFPLVPVSPAWIAVAKLSEGLWRVVPILLLMTAGGASLRSLYLTRGRLGPGLSVGFAGFVVCAALAFLPLLGKPGGWTKLVSLAPWILTFVLANGFTEELLFRGLFLQRFEPFLGKGLSNLLAAAAFTLLHLRTTNASGSVVLLLVLFPLALACGWLMQKTGSVWGSALFHAGADCLVIFGIYGLA
jgi:membrane protease YdiL (CAAX protease family)